MATKIVSRFFPEMHKVGQDGGLFLRQLRDTVQEVKAEDPSLADYHLYDLGFIQQENGLEVKMYFEG
ncbi:hypothetical protein Tfer_0356 [Thermincola ferriacetica]|uniref:Uncharacterized protein n=1 Tax=Thermincola ferriacetica TaxID=281456 RepID=A0A0L6W5M5_9FIRM|nr:hypothetical protein [Thermincola ferriacetica]KNZ70678.1 hypothetical protein Tfer_0356 [Thermincola ferriacetica]